MLDFNRDRPVGALGRVLGLGSRPVGVSYGERALAEEVADVESAPVGSRSAALNKAAFSLGQIVVLGGLHAETVETELLNAATNNGLLRKNGRTDVLRTIRVAMRAGEAKPRDRQVTGLRPDPAARLAAKARAEAIRAEDADRARRSRAFCAAIWNGTTHADAGPVMTYLRDCRGLDTCPPVLRFHPAAPFGPDTPRVGAAMIGLVQNRAGEAIGLHRTGLLSDGSDKIPGRSKLMFGKVAGGAVRLADYNEELAVAEGIETALSFTKRCGVPCWALLSTSGFVNFEIPLDVRRLVIAADRDDHGAGVRYATDLAERARTMCQVAVALAPEGDKDWNDALRSKAHG